MTDLTPRREEEETEEDPPPRERRNPPFARRRVERTANCQLCASRSCGNENFGGRAAARACGIFHGARFHVRFNIKTIARKVSLPPSRFPLPRFVLVSLFRCFLDSLLRLALTHASGWSLASRARTRARCN